MDMLANKTWLIVMLLLIFAGSATADIRLILPPRIYAVPGLESNIYFDNIMLVKNMQDYTVCVKCSKGRQLSDRWMYNPKPDEAGEYPLTISVLDDENKPVASATTSLRVAKPDAGGNLDVRMLIIGDSLTYAGVYPDEIYKLCQRTGNPKLTLLGSRPPNSSAEYLRYEGYGGWSFAMFCTGYTEPDIINGRRARSPFVFKENGKPALNFARYVKEQCGGSAPDIVAIGLGTNDIFLGTDADIDAKIDTIFSYADKLISNIKAAGPDTKIGFLLLVPPAASQDAFGENYGCMQTRWQYRRNQHRYVERQFQKYGGREKEGLHLIPTYTNIDTVYNFPRREVFANNRTDIRIVRMVNGVHPSADGYRQMADSIYCWLKNILQN